MKGGQGSEGGRSSLGFQTVDFELASPRCPVVCFTLPGISLIPSFFPPLFLCSGSVLHAEAWAAGPEPLLINFSVKTSSEAGWRMQPALTDITGFDTRVISDNAKGLHQTRVKMHKRDGAKFEPLFVSRQPGPWKINKRKSTSRATPDTEC